MCHVVISRGINLQIQQSKCLNAQLSNASLQDLVNHSAVHVSKRTHVNNLLNTLVSVCLVDSNIDSLVITKSRMLAIKCDVSL